MTPRWKKIRQLEENLLILKPARRMARMIINTMIEEAISLIEKHETPLIVARAIVSRGHFKYSSVHVLFSELSDFSPPLLKRHNNFDSGKIATFTSSFFDVCNHDLKIYKQMISLNAVNSSDQASIERLEELLKKFRDFVA